ncbi:hypothetical protein [Heyndrickxia coagulans]|uniref:hypothetical protein n=1 Tax=Heyndrickxia coagulans TaxID=1398 RepID=UPI0003796C91|nr:hypothetical protein [Heyndrickxia coagulans]
MDKEMKNITNQVINHYLCKGIIIENHHTFTCDDFLFKNGSLQLKVKTKAKLAAIELEHEITK